MKLKPFEVDEILAALYGPYKDRLTVWESGFVGSVNTRWTLRKHLSDNEEKMLRDIWTEVTSNRRSKSVVPPPSERPLRIATVHTTVPDYYELRVSGLKEAEAHECIDILRARGYVDG